MSSKNLCMHCAPIEEWSKQVGFIFGVCCFPKKGSDLDEFIDQKNKNEVLLSCTGEETFPSFCPIFSKPTKRRTILKKIDKSMSCTKN